MLLRSNKANFKGLLILRPSEFISNVRGLKPMAF